jgi:hypothetical protein
MPISALGAGLSAPPVHLADLRPAADAAATRRLYEPPHPAAMSPFAAFPPITPPSAISRAEVGRSLLATTAIDGADMTLPVERTLKPYGIAMLPSDGNGEATGNAPGDARTGAPRDASGDGETPAGRAPDARD